MKAWDVFNFAILAAMFTLNLFTIRKHEGITRKIQNNVAFELEGRILRCNDVISNDASVEISKRAKK